jgi:poly-gamma-glutamate capsule biosynthesis protein CapA/YwtB (metallophosphatase superfamily)
MRNRRTTLICVALVAVGAAVAATAAAAPGAISGAPATATAGAHRLDPPARTLLVALGGDVLNESAVNLAGAAAAGPGERYDFAPLFAPIAPVIAAADLAICHAELPIGAPGERTGLYGRSPFGGNLLLAPYELAQGLADTGFDRCSTSSNHSFDTGVSGIASTLAALDAAGLSHAGTARSPDEAVPDVFTVNGVRVAHLAYTRSSNTVPPRDAWMLSRALTAAQVVTDVRAARADGAEIVIVSLHLGVEMQREPTDTDLQFAYTITDPRGDARIDLLVHHGPHVSQQLAYVNGTFTYWSVGNFVSGMGTPGSGKYADQRTLDGLLATARFTETAPGVFHVDPWPVALCTSKIDRTVWPAIVALQDPVAVASMSTARLAELRACAGRATALMGVVH